MDNELIKILLVEDNPGDATLVRLALPGTSSTQFQLTHVEQLAEMFQCVSRDSYHVILLDLSLPDSHGLDTFIRAQLCAPSLPIIVLSGSRDESAAVKAVRLGAQDYLVKGQFDSRLLTRALRYAIERKQIEAELREIADESARSNQQLRVLASDMKELAATERQARLELEQAHVQLKRTQAQLVQAAKLAAIGELVAGVAHEINNPLAFLANDNTALQRDIADMGALLGLFERSETIIAQHDTELHRQIRELADGMDLAYTLSNLQRILQRSRDGLRRIQQIVQNLRGFARVDEHDWNEVHDLNASLLSTLNIIQGRAQQMHVELETDLPPLPPVTCSLGKVNQVVLNLVANAIDACAGGGQVTVRTRSSAAGVEIHVIDTGHGIDPVIRDRIFDPFFTTKPVGKGTGLGLSISYGIVQEHGGSIEVDSAPGQGTHFVVRLPLKQKPRELTDLARASAASVTNLRDTPAAEFSSDPEVWCASTPWQES